MNQVETTHTVDKFQLNERLWQAWLYKNRESDRARAAKWRWALLVLLGIAVVAGVIQNLIG